MIDTFGRSITYLRVSVTELCNLRCRYCMPEDGVCKKEHADMLTEDELIQAVEAAAALGITKLRITGGEPLVKKNIVSICRRASKVPGIREVCLTTNGILLPELARPLKEAGVRSMPTLPAAAVWMTSGRGFMRPWMLTFRRSNSMPCSLADLTMMRSFRWRSLPGSILWMCVLLK